MYYIPNNFTDSGKILGMFFLRNLAEALIIALPLLYFSLKYIPLPLTWRILISITLTVPTSGFALLGIDDVPLSSYIRIWLCWRMNRTIRTQKERADEEY